MVRVQDLILDVQERPAVGELKKHNRELGKRFVFLDDKNFAKTKLYVASRSVRGITRSYQSAAPRTHRVDAVMIFTGFREDLTGLRAEVVLNGKHFFVNSPAAVYVPAKVKHTYKMAKGSGIMSKIVLVPGGDWNSVTF